jgi:hypothetical protein
LEAADNVIDLSDEPRSRPFVGDFNADGTPDLLVGSADGTVRLYAGTWAAPPGEATGQRPGWAGDPYIHRIRVHPAAYWQNPINRFDVNGQDGVTPLDVLLVINYINAHPGHSGLPAAPAVPPPFYNVDGNDAITALDVLLVINYINSHPSGSGEAEDVAGLVMAGFGDSESQPVIDLTGLADVSDPLPIRIPRDAGSDPAAIRVAPDRIFDANESASTGKQDVPGVVWSSVNGGDETRSTEKPNSPRKGAAQRDELLTAITGLDDLEFESTLDSIADDISQEWSV